MLNPLKSANYETYMDFCRAINSCLQKNPYMSAHIIFEDFREFSCSKCGDCCERPWQIALDKVYYDRYYQFFDTHPTGQFKNPFVRLSPNKNAFASIRRKEASHECIFLESDRRCYIHRHYGEDFLPVICRQYPRLNQLKTNQHHFFSLQASCKSVPQLWWGNRHLICRFLPMKERKLSIYLTSTQVLEPAGFLMWLGFCFDYLNQKGATVESFESLMQSFKRMTELKKETVLEEDVIDILETFNSEEWICRSTNQILDLVVEFAQQSQNEAMLKLLENTYLPDLDRLKSLSSIFCPYMMHKLLTYPYWIRRGFSLKDFYILLSFQWSMIYLLSLNPQTELNQVVNLVESVLEGTADFLGKKLKNDDFLSMIQLCLSSGKMV